jgi:hypothetical protein
MVFIFDYVALQLGFDKFPLEIALLNTNLPDKCHVVYIKYPCNYFNNFSAKQYCNNHGLTWQEGDETLYSAMHTITKQLVVNTHCEIVVNSYDKLVFLHPWFKNVLVFDNSSLPLQKQIFPCYRHACDNNNKHRCARTECVNLMLSYNNSIMYINNPTSLIIHHTSYII